MCWVIFYSLFAIFYFVAFGSVIDWWRNSYVSKEVLLSLHPNSGLTSTGQFCDWSVWAVYGLELLLLLVKCSGSVWTECRALCPSSKFVLVKGASTPLKMISRKNFVEMYAALCTCLFGLSHFLPYVQVSLSLEQYLHATAPR